MDANDLSILIQQGEGATLEFKRLFLGHLHTKSWHFQTA